MQITLLFVTSISRFISNKWKPVPYKIFSFKIWGEKYFLSLIQVSYSKQSLLQQLLLPFKFHIAYVLSAVDLQSDIHVIILIELAPCLDW